ncbi:MAG: S-layer homology domain-containing protein [Clostridia bacterium]|nr:S-layer homology domain-containing protein [Clostridia bacterium]
MSEYGAVKRGEDDIPVRLTATVNVNGSLATKSFDVIVKSRLTAEQKNKEVVSQDKANLEIVYAPGDYDENVTTNLTLLECGSAGSIISWSSNNESVISSVGVVKRQQYDTWVTLTADIIRGTVYETKTFSVLVKGTGKATEVENTEDPEDNDEIPENSPAPINVEVPIEGAEALIQRIVDTLEIGYANGDSEKSVTMKLTLPTVGTEGIPINWTSSLPAVVTPYGGVVRQVEDTNVTLTATVSYGDISLEKVFTVTVKAADEIPQNPNNGQEEEIAVKNHRSSSGRTSTSESGNSGSGGGGTTGAVTVPTATAEPSTISDNANNEKKQRFIDIDDVPWAQNAINTLADDGVISGTSANTYSPHLSIRRADFVMLLVKLYKLDTEITETFEDVTEDKYYYSDVSKAKSLGIISGIDETHFKPEDSISRQDMMIMTYRALMKLNKVEEVDEADITTFKDYKNISDYALAGVKYLVSAGVVHGDTDFNINPKANTTRAETAVFLFGLVK